MIRRSLKIFTQHSKWAAPCGPRRCATCRLRSRHNDALRRSRTREDGDLTFAKLCKDGGTKSMGIPGSWNGGTVPYKAIFWGYIPLHRPYIGLIYGRYLQFRFLKWPLTKHPVSWSFPWWFYQETWSWIFFGQSWYDWMIFSGYPHDWIGKQPLTQ